MTLEELVGSILEIAPAELSDDSGRESLMAWTSLAHIDIMLAVEELYQVAFQTEEIQSLQTIGDIRASLLAKGCRL